MVQSVNRALSIMDLFTRESLRLGITEISKSLGLSKPTVHALVSTLVNQGYLQQDPSTKKYGLGLKIYELGFVISGSLEINRKGVGPAYQLAKQSGLVARIGIWDMESILLTVNIEHRSHLFFSTQIGPRIPAYCTGVGKAVLAFLKPEEINSYLNKIKLESYTPHTITKKGPFLKDMEATRERGYSIDREETVLGLACIGAPIFGFNAHLEGAISISGDAKDVFDRMESLAPKLLDTAQEISRSLGHFPGSLGIKI